MILTLCVQVSFAVNTTSQIDIGLTRINLAYGWMRACDVAFLRQRAQVLQAGLHLNASAAFTPFFLAKRTSDLITRLRMNCWRLEMRCLPINHFSDEGPDLANSDLVFSDGVIEIIRETKRKLAIQINERIAILEDFEYPVFPTDDFIEDDDPSKWLEFEFHSPNSFWYAEGYRSDLEAFEKVLQRFGSSATEIDRLMEPGCLFYENITGYHQRVSLWGDEFVNRSGEIISPATPPELTSM